MSIPRIASGCVQKLVNFFSPHGKRDYNTTSPLSSMTKPILVEANSIPSIGNNQTPSYQSRISKALYHYPRVFPRTSTLALSNATLPYALKLANLSFREAMESDDALRKGLNVLDGKVTNRFVAESLGLDYTPFKP